MAYINCKKCGCQMSDKSEACPMCGEPVTENVEQNTEQTPSIPATQENTTPVGMDLEEFHKQNEEQQQTPVDPVQNEPPVNDKGETSPTSIGNNESAIPPTPIVPNNPKKTNKNTLIIGIFAAVVIVAAVAVFFLMKGNKGNVMAEEETGDPCLTVLNQLYNNYVFPNPNNNDVPAFGRMVDDWFTRNGKQKLLDAYDYDCETGDCYGIWALRTMAQDGEGESKVVEIMSVGKGKYTVKYLDMGTVGETMVTFAEEGGKMKIDDFRTIFDESYDDNVGYNSNGSKLKGYEWLKGVWAGVEGSSFGRVIVTDTYYQVVNSNMDDAFDAVEAMTKEDITLKEWTNYADGDNPTFGFSEYIGIDKENQLIYIIQGEYFSLVLHKIQADFESAVFIANHQYPKRVYSNAYDGFVNIRQSPNGKAPILGVLRNGPDGAVLIGTEGEWKEVNCLGVVGYVSGKYVQDTPTEVFKDE